MPIWFIEMTLIFVFGIPLALGLLALLVIGTWIQVQDEKGEKGNGKADKLYA